MSESIVSFMREATCLVPEEFLPLGSCAPAEGRAPLLEEPRQPGL